MYKGNIVLVGFMASGKSTVGKLLASKLNFDFIDTDQFIEKEEGTEISQMFKVKGESYFREKESFLLKQFENLSNAVISTGGGMVLDSNNKELLKKIGKVIYLVASPEWILFNLERSNTVRPLLHEEGQPMDKIKELLKNREEHYEKVSDFNILVDYKSPEEIVENVISLIK